jgi:hypothetical protein
MPSITTQPDQVLQEVEYEIAQIGRGIDQSIKWIERLEKRQSVKDDKKLYKLLEHIINRLWEMSDEIDEELMKVWEVLDL